MSYNKRIKLHGGNMKFLVFSDSHKSTNGMDKAIERHKDITHIIHCGDVADDCEYLEMVYGRTHSICAVCGNNDFFSHYPLERIIKCEGHMIYVTHGHKERVKSGLYGLKAKGKEKNVIMCIFGHTHEQFYENDDIHILNPGSIGYIKEEYAVIDINKDEIKVSLYKI